MNVVERMEARGAAGHLDGETGGPRQQHARLHEESA